jgi:hypothetical protein
MNRKYSVGVLILGCVSALAIGRGQDSARPQTKQSSTPTILSGGCAPGKAYNRGAVPVFGLGQYATTTCIAYHGVINPTSGVPMPSAGVLQNLRAVGGTTERTGQEGVLTIYVNGVSSSLTCTIDASGVCSDTTNTVSVNAGDSVAAVYVPGPDLSLTMSASVEKQ